MVKMVIVSHFSWVPYIVLESSVLYLFCTCDLFGDISWLFQHVTCFTFFLLLALSRTESNLLSPYVS